MVKVILYQVYLFGIAIKSVFHQQWLYYLNVKQDETGDILDSSFRLRQLTWKPLSDNLVFKRQDIIC